MFRRGARGSITANVVIMFCVVGHSYDVAFFINPAGMRPADGQFAQSRGARAFVQSTEKQVDEYFCKIV